MGYTKGDWKVEDDWNILSGKRLVANCGGYAGNYESVVEENKANAQLIAAAPNLYKALQESTSVLLATLVLMKTEEGKESIKEQMNQYSQALAKVYGGK